TIVPRNFRRDFDIDGCFVSSTYDDGKTYGYTYVFRSGAVEAVDVELLCLEQQMIQYKTVEEKVAQAAQRYLSLLTSLEVPGPYALFLSLLNVKGYFMPASPGCFRKGHPISRDNLYISEVIFDSVPESVPSALFRVFN